MSRKRIILVTAGIMLSLFLDSMESTVVAAAMPVIMSPLDEASRQISCGNQHANVH